MMLRERGVGNSVNQLAKKIREQHSENWLNCTAQYLTACEPFVKSGFYPGAAIKPVPPFQDLPRPQWLMTVCIRDVFQRMDEVKAKVTSTYGSILKMDSTKKVRLIF